MKYRKIVLDITCKRTRLHIFQKKIVFPTNN